MMLQAVMKSNPGSDYIYVVDTRPKVTHTHTHAQTHIHACMHARTHLGDNGSVVQSQPLQSAFVLRQDTKPRLACLYE